jgi:hypothetical protein
MKKVIFTLMIAICAVAVVNAQDLTSKKGVPILPEAGDYAIGINAIPFFQYVGNMFNANAFNPGPAFNFIAPTPMTIYGKYFKDANTAYRYFLRLGYNSETFKNLTPQDGSTTTPPAMVDDKMTVSNMALHIGVGLEKRRGAGRVQGFYGAEAGLMVANENMVKYTYGNSLSATTGTWYDFGGEGYNPGTTPRPLKESDGLMFGLGVRAFVGVEYFFAPKISIGGEFGWGIGFMAQGKGKAETEVWTTAVETTEFETAGGSMFHLDTDNLGGSINLLFYF